MERPSVIDASRVWPDILSDIRSQIGEQRFSLWIGHTELLRCDEQRVEIGVPNLFVQEWLEGHFRDLFADACAKRLPSRPDVHFVIHGKLFQESRQKALQAQEEIVVEAAQQAGKGPRSRINSDFVLDKLVVGSFNKLAAACAQELIRGEGARFNPLFLHSASGLGKTHILQAIWWGLRQTGDGRRVAYAAAEEFSNQFVYAMRSGKLDAFRHRYRGVDVLLIDDVHFLCAKSGFQDEFLHTYDVLEAEGKQVVLASDVHPKMLPSLKESLVSRFASGMVVRIGQPEFTARVEILKQKCARQTRAVSEEVLRYIARGFEGNIRELRGALTAVMAYASLSRREITMDLAREALGQISHQPARRVDMEAIEKAVAMQFGVSSQDLHSRRRSRAIALPRQVCMFLARELTCLSCAEVARHFGGDHHTTVVFAHRRVRELCDGSRETGEVVQALKERLLGR